MKENQLININELSQLEEVIDNAMLSPELSHETLRKKYKINVKEEIPPPQVAWSLANVKEKGDAILGTLGNFGLIIGKAKAKKSFFVNIAVSTALSDDYLLGRFKSSLPKNQSEVLYFDTEQGKYHVQTAIKRICSQINIEEPTNLNAFHLRSLSPYERLEFIEKEIYRNDKIGFVVIDGIKDLVTSINDESEATMITSKLLKWTEERNIYILTVLHQNKGDNNARGHIGTELINKAETVLSVTKSESDSSISTVEPQQCRNIEPETFAFEIINGLPVIAENYELRTETKRNKFDVIDLEDAKKFDLLTKVYKQGESFSYSNLMIQLQLAYKDSFNKRIADNNTKKLITDCKNSGWLLQMRHKAPYTLGKFCKTEVDQTL